MTLTSVPASRTILRYIWTAEGHLGCTIFSAGGEVVHCVMEPLKGGHGAGEAETRGLCRLVEMASIILRIGRKPSGKITWFGEG